MNILFKKKKKKCKINLKKKNLIVQLEHNYILNSI